MFLQTMNALDLFTKLYGKLQNYGMPFWLMTPFRRVVRGLANVILPCYLSRPAKLSSRKERNLIVSFTSFPDHIGDVWKVVECLKKQTVLPEKIILWLSDEQFPGGSGIPDTLRKQEDSLFNIRLVKDDVRSHKKYLYVLQEYPDMTLITCDDDVFYDPRMIERLVNTSLRFPNCIISNHTHIIRHTSNGELTAYRQWSSEVSEYESEDLLQVGVGGVLYPPHCLHPLVIQTDVFRNVAPLADDIWLNAMARLNHTPIVKASGNVLSLPVANEGPDLCSVNNGAENMKDKQIRQIRAYLIQEGYPDVYASSYVVKAQGGEGNFIVSFTTFPARINNVWQVVECMKRQTLKPDKILLWLSKDQFPSEDSIPDSLLNRRDEQFEIRMVEGDIRSHKKYYYATKEYPDDLLFLIDDDIYYDTDIIRRSVKAYIDYAEKCVVCNYGSRISYDENVCKPYSEWQSIEGKKAVGKELFFGSGGGTLFRPSDMYEDLTNIELAKRLTPLADDIWLNTMAMKAGLTKIMLPHGPLLPVRMKENVTLSSVNNGEGQNNNQLEAVRLYYGDIFVYPFDTGSDGSPQ